MALLSGRCMRGKYQMRTVTPTVTATAMIVASGLSTTANLVKIGLTAADNFDGGRGAGRGRADHGLSYPRSVERAL